MKTPEMTIDEAIYCMESYMYGTESDCLGCKYHGAFIHDGVGTCRSSEAHRIAVVALNYFKRYLNGDDKQG